MTPDAASVCIIFDRPRGCDQMPRQAPSDVVSAREWEVIKMAVDS
jgi:hypothetical protein